jgi:poly-gamma-glutamate synthesis protein (capsule biosynthesis protein)
MEDDGLMNMENKTNFKLLCLGDFSPTLPMLPLSLSLDLNPYDLVLLNLETPIVRGERKRMKAGPSLVGDEHLIRGFLNQKMVVNLANNHIMDYGTEGLKNTLELCEKLNVSTIGAGLNLKAALRPVIKEVNEIKVGIIGCAETQFGTSTSSRPGFASIQPGTTEKAISRLSDEVDICIVSVHGAAEMSPWPSPAWQDMMRGFIDAGADLIHGHHSHVPQGFEKYNNGYIFYGLGNFLVDPSQWKNRDNTLWSIAPALDISRDGITQVRIQTITINETKNGKSIELKLHEYPESTVYKSYLTGANSPLDNPETLESLWQEISIRLFTLNYSKWLKLTTLGRKGIPPSILQKLRKKLNVALISIKSDDDLLLLYHLFACKSHQEAIVTALGVISGELDDLRTEKTKKLADCMMPWSKMNL